MECYKVEIPPDVQLCGYTAAGERVRILPGGYHVHRLRPKLPMRIGVEALRFVGALDPNTDIHIPLHAGVDVHSVLPPQATARLA